MYNKLRYWDRYYNSIRTRYWYIVANNTAYKRARCYQMYRLTLLADL
jgi:hypothetical protein